MPLAEDSPDVSLPRHIVPGATYLITRRTHQRARWFAPARWLEHLFLFCLFWAAEKRGVLVNACVLAPSHFHLLVTDVRGELPEFCRLLTSLFARAFNCNIGRWESLFTDGSYGAVHCIDGPAQLDRLLYVLTHPIKDNWVSTPERWPGVLTLARELDGREFVLRRPGSFFRETGKNALPPEVVARYAPLPGYEHLTPRAYAQHIERAVAARIAELKARPGGNRFAGASTARRLERGSLPKTPTPRRNLNPRIACKDRQRRIAAKLQLVAFWRDHKAARLSWRAGDSSAVFPSGTYWHRIHTPAHVAPLPNRAPP